MHANGAPEVTTLGQAPDPAAGLRADKVERAAADLAADFQRQNGLLKQAQFDRLVLRRNLSPAEMVALIAKLLSVGITVDQAPASKQKRFGGSLPEATQPISLPNKNVASGGQTRSPYALLTPQQEIELGRRVQLALRIQSELDAGKVESIDEQQAVERGRAARDRMVVANLRLVRFVIRHMNRPVAFLDSWDLFQEGVIGLMKAVERFDPELGLRFSTYALWWIRQAVFRGLDDTDRAIRLPVHRMESIRRLRVTTRRLAYELGREPTIRELSDGLNWAIEKTLFIQRLTQLECISLDSPIGKDGELTVGETIISREPGPFEAVSHAQRRDLLRGFLARLSPRQKLVIERRFGLGDSTGPETLQQLGDQLGVTRERVRQIEEKALWRLSMWVNRRMYDALL
jgi:RNA polymerase sigma factor (sigma-70 family)